MQVRDLIEELKRFDGYEVVTVAGSPTTTVSADCGKCLRPVRVTVESEERKVAAVRALGGDVLLETTV